MVGIFKNGIFGNDFIFGTADADTLLGQGGNDTIEGGAGADDLDGGLWRSDFLSYRTSPAAVLIGLAGSQASGGDATGDVFRNFEGVLGSDHNDTLVGDGKDNRLFGRDGNDSLSGRGGFDSLYGGRGIDKIEGGDGNDVIRGGRGSDNLDGGSGEGDVLSYVGSFAGVAIDLALNKATGGDAKGDAIQNFEFVLGSSFDDTLVGDDVANVLKGVEGRDLIDGGGGNDTLFGGARADQISGGQGRDEIEGGAGADTLDGGAGQNDALSYRTSSAGVKVDLGHNTAGGGDADGDVIQNFERVIGSDFNDLLIGGDKFDRLFGRDGRDVVRGGDGNDVVDGGRGADTVRGGAGDDLGIFANVGAPTFDRYNGDDGIDTLRFKLSAAEYFFSRQDLNAYVDHVAAGRSADVFQMNSLMLRAVNWEMIDITVDIGEDRLGEGSLTETPGETGSNTTMSEHGALVFLAESVPAPSTVTVALRSATWSAGAVPEVLITLLKGGFSARLAETVGGVTLLDWSFAVAESELDLLSEADTLALIYDIMLEGGGDSEAAEVRLLVNGQSDDPTLANGALATNEGNIALLDLTTLGDDPDAEDDGTTLIYEMTAQPTQGIATIDGNTLMFDPNDEFSNIAAGASRQVSLEVTARDSQGAMASNTIIVTVTGSDNQPALTGDTTGEVTEDADQNTLITGGFLVIENPDGSEGMFRPQAGTFGSNGIGSFDLFANGTWNYQADNSQDAVQELGDGDSIKDTFTGVSVNGIEQTVTVTIVGVNDDALIHGDVAVEIEEDASPETLVASGTLVIADADAGEAHFVGQASTEGSNGVGTFTILDNGRWTYSADNTQFEIQGLDAGESLTDSFTAVSADGTEQTVTVTINGVTDYALFSAKGAQGSGLYITDGTPEGTVRISPSRLDSISDFTLLGDLAVFSARGDELQELYVTDGTPEGTQLLADIQPFGESRPGGFTVLGDQILFSAEGPVGRELYITDGTPAGTTLLADINSAESSFPGGFIVLGDQALFTATGPSGRELYVTDGTSEGTRLLADINPEGSSSPSDFALLGDQVLFEASGPDAREPYVTDGTPGGTMLLADINPIASSNPRGFTVFGDLALFQATSPNGSQLFITDGTSEGTKFLADINPRPGGNPDASEFTVLGNKVLFSARGPEGEELYITDGTPEGTMLVADILPEGSNGSYPQRFTIVGDQAVFTAFGPRGNEPYITDGTPDGTNLIADIMPTSSSNAIGLTAFGDRVLFSAIVQGNGDREPFITDGTREGTCPPSAPMGHLT